LKSYFILPIHNKEALLENVLQGIVDSVSGDYKIIAILDGCTDKSEKILTRFIKQKKIQDKVKVLHLPDVHEITCLNHGLTQVKMDHPNDDDLVFTVQDDVILMEPNIDGLFRNLFNQIPNLGYVSMRLGAQLAYNGVDEITDDNWVESEFGHWKQLGWTHFKEAKHYEFHVTQLAIRSPTCVLWKRYKEIGFYDPALAPCGFDCHDFSIRMQMRGYQNGIYALRFRSDLDWGGMRTQVPSEINKKHGEIYEKNRRYLGLKHRSFLLTHTK